MRSPQSHGYRIVSTRRNRFWRVSAFSLVELLTVIGIVALLGAATVPVVDRLGSASGPAGAAAIVSQALSEARAHAISKRTYAYVVIGGFQAESVNSGSNREGRARLSVGVLATDDGSPLPGGPVDAARTRFVTRISSVNNAAVATVTGRHGGLDRRESGALVQDFWAAAESGPQVRFPLGGTARYSFPQRVIEFAPDGTARMAGSPEIPRAIEIGLIPSRGERVLEDSPDVGVVQVSGLTGAATIYRP